MQNKYQEDIKLKNNILFLNEYVNNYSMDEYSPLNTEI